MFATAQDRKAWAFRDRTKTMSKKPPGLPHLGVWVKGYTSEGACLAVKLRRTPSGGFTWGVWPLIYNTKLSDIVRWEPFEKDEEP